MSIDKLIEIISRLPAGSVFENGFYYAHSYRGYYDQLAVEPKEKVTAMEMVKCLTSAVGETFEGYKGGYFYMDGSQDVYLAWHGSCGQKIIGIGETDSGPVLILEDDE